MKEGPSHLPKGDPRREKIAEQIRLARRRDRDRLTGYVIGRSGVNYVFELEGVKGLFDYVRTLSSNVVLDIGAGHTRGAHELANSPLGENLTFEATVLSRLSGIDTNLGRESVRSTSAEMLRGIDTNSVGCVIAVYSIAYSAAPEVVIASIDRVLVPGGVLKAKFHQKNVPQYVADSPKYVDEFHLAAANLGYEVALQQSSEESVLLAIKPNPGVSPHVTARQLLRMDAETAESQIENFRRRS